MDAKKNIFRLLFLIMGYCLTMTSCSDDNNTDWNLAPLLTTRSVVTPDFDWEKLIGCRLLQDMHKYQFLGLEQGVYLHSMKQTYLMIINLLMDGRCFIMLLVQKLLM